MNAPKPITSIDARAYVLRIAETKAKGGAFLRSSRSMEMRLRGRLHASLVDEPRDARYAHEDYLIALLEAQEAKAT